MAGEQIALFHFDGKTRVLCHSDGRLGGAAVKFPNLDAAVAYANEYVQANAARGCRLHDATGACVREIAGAKVPTERYTRAAAKRDLLIGLMGFAIIPVGYLVDHWIGWGIFLGMALGTKFVLLGIVKLSDGIAGLMEPRR
jgi:hypothetical protein